MIYEREEPIDMTHERLARLCGCTVTNFKKALSALIDEGKLVEVSGGLWNTRAGCELEKRTAKREDAKIAASKRWEKTQQNQSDDDANAVRTQYESDANQNQNQNQNIDTNVSISNTRKARSDVSSEIVDAISQWASAEAATSFIAYRKKIKKPLTLTAAKRLANNLEQIFAAGGNTDDALGLAEERGWQTVKPEWYFNEQQRSNGRTGGARSGMADAFAAVAARIAAEQGGR